MENIGEDPKPVQGDVEGPFAIDKTSSCLSNTLGHTILVTLLTIQERSIDLLPFIMMVFLFQFMHHARRVFWLVCLHLRQSFLKSLGLGLALSPIPR